MYRGDNHQMNWLTNFVKPKLRALVGKDVPENLWDKCSKCGQLIFHRDFEENMNVCKHCGHHMGIAPRKRLEQLYDDNAFEEISLPDVVKDPLKFKDLKKYTDRIKDARNKTGEQDAIVLASGTVGGKRLVTAAFDFRYMGGSMGVAVGSSFIKAAQHALETNSAFLVIPASGGARMQEGILSLMQMARTTVVVSQLKEAGLPYLVLLSDPTAGGVTASFAMIGDVTLAEPGATICFSGRRVIEQTIKQELPEGFQTTEYLYDHGMIDIIVKRQELRSQLQKLLGLMVH